MNKPKSAQNQEQNHKPRIICFSVMPGLEPELYEPLLISDLDALIIGTVPTGGVPNEGRYSFIPFIRRATDLQLPVYLLRGSLSAAGRPPNERKAYRRDMDKIYQPERDAIRAAVIAGGTPLERPDISQLFDVVNVLRRVYAQRPEYVDGIGKVSGEFSSPEFVQAIKKMRE